MTTAIISEIKKASNGRIIMYLESIFVDDLGLEYSRKTYRRGYDGAMETKLEALKGKEVVFEDSAVEIKDFKLPNDHEKAGEIVKLAWVTGNISLKK